MRSAFGNAEIVGLKGLSLRTELVNWAGARDSNEVANLSAGGGQVSFVNRARPTKKIPRLLAAGRFIWNGIFSRQGHPVSGYGVMRTRPFFFRIYSVAETVIRKNRWASGKVPSK